MVGRKPKPTHLKILEGNPGKRPLNKNEPKPPPGKPTCPAWLLLEAKREWKRVCPILHKIGLLTKIDRTALAGYCQAYARWREAEEQINEHESTYVAPGYLIKQSPWVGIAHKNLTIVRGFCGEFGLTPSSRSRINLPGQEDDNDGLLS